MPLLPAVALRSLTIVAFGAVLALGHVAFAAADAGGVQATPGERAAQACPAAGAAKHKPAARTCH